jgi:hypothetical protein
MVMMMVDDGGDYGSCGDSGHSDDFGGSDDGTSGVIMVAVIRAYLIYFQYISSLQLQSVIVSTT